MIQDSQVNMQKQERFIEEVCKTGIVWSLENSDGFATSQSNEYEDTEGNPVQLICFWSGEQLAKDCIKAEWHDYKPVKQTLGDFIESWCIGMYNDGFLIGSDFDADMFGYELDPLEMIGMLHAELTKLGKQIQLANYKSLDELVEEIEGMDNE